MAITQLHQQRLQDQTINSSMSRQALINGNFDIWQRATTATNPTNATFPTADRYLVNVVNTGTLPTNIVHSRQTLTGGDILGSYYFHRTAPDGSGSGFGVNDYYANLRQKIEYGVSKLCGLNKQVTVSFYARSSIGSKKLAINLYQDYGTGGSPSSTEVITGQTWTLTSNWTRYTATFTTNTLVGKTFGTAGNENLSLQFYVMWGSNIAPTLGTTGTETFVGAGNIDIAQVQLCAGSEALPFEPKSYGQELVDCQRYAQAFLVPANVGLSEYGPASSTTIAYPWLHLTTPLRTNPTVFTVTATDWVLADTVSAGIDVTALSITGYDQLINCTRIQFQCTVASGLTQFRSYDLASDASGPRRMVISAEL